MRRQNKSSSETLMNVKAVVFDLDGTIVEFNLDYKSARAEVIQFLSNQGFPKSIFSLNETVFEMLRKLEIYIRNHPMSHIDYSELRKHVLTILEKYELESATSTRLVPGIFETLQTLKKMVFKLGIFTVNSQKSTDYILSVFKLKPFFEAVVTRDSVPDVKPNPIHLETVLKMLKAKPEETLVVGDSVLDMKAAQELKVYSVGVSTGVSSPEELTRVGIDCLITSPTDLIALIERLKQTNSS
jgi:HAD superfamily hydrolase (TIGR01549 family)